MILRGWEMIVNTSEPIQNALVSAIPATLTHPNPGTAVSQTFTNSSGMWEFASLADGQNYDVKVEWSGRTRWYKGLTAHNLQHLADDTTPDPNRNLLNNGGQDSWVERGTGAITVPTADPGAPNTSDGWATYFGTGDSGQAQAETGTVATNSKNSIRVAYTRVGGQATHYRELPDQIWQQQKGRQLAFSAQAYQASADSGLRAFIDDGVSVTYGTAPGTVGSWMTLGVTKTISPSATKVRMGVQTNRANTGLQTFYLDNLIADYGSNPPIFASEVNDGILTPLFARSTIVEAAPVSDSGSVATLLNNLAHRVMTMIGGTDWKDAPAANLGQLVKKAGDTMTGRLHLNGESVQFDAIETGLIFSGLTQLYDTNTGIGNHFEGRVFGNRIDFRTFDGVGTILQMDFASNNPLWKGHPLLKADGDTITGDTSLANASIRILTNLFGLVFSSGSQMFDRAATESFIIRAAGDRIEILNEAGTTLMLLVTPSLFQYLGQGVIHSGNIGAQSVNFATTAGTASDATNLGGVPASNYPRRATGGYTGDGVAKTVNLGWGPTYVVIQESVGTSIFLILTGVSAVRMMGGGAAWGFPSGVALVSNGFTIGTTQAEANLSGQSYRWVAFG